MSRPAPPIVFLSLSFCPLYFTFKFLSAVPNLFCTWPTQSSSSQGQSHTLVDDPIVRMSCCLHLISGICSAGCSRQSVGRWPKYQTAPRLHGSSTTSEIDGANMIFFPCPILSLSLVFIFPLFAPTAVFREHSVIDHFSGFVCNDKDYPEKRGESTLLPRPVTTYQDIDDLIWRRSRSSSRARLILSSTSVRAPIAMTFMCC